MGNQHTHEKPEEKKSVGVLTSVQQLEEWLPGTVKKIEKGALAARRDVQDWEDDDDDVFYLFLQKQKIGAKLHIYL